MCKRRKYITTFKNSKIIRNKSNKKLETLWRNLLNFIRRQEKKKWEMDSVTRDEDFMY